MATAGTSSLDEFITRFTTQIDSGFGVISGDVQVVLGTLVVISIVLTAIMWAVDETQNVIAPLVRKILLVGFFAWLVRSPSARAKSDETLGAVVRRSFLMSDRTYGARRVWRDVLEAGFSCGLHRVERLMALQALKARPRRRRLPSDTGERIAGAIAPNALDRQFEAARP
ncbi:MAG: hypothetical protein B7Z44_13620, partial [Caulobacter sp. 12-67-6]